jgi:Tfp pilus assembly protein PilX
MRKTRVTRTGVVAVLAMMFLVLFAALALGVYAASNTNVIVADNERRASIALGACESGTDFIR